MHDYVPPIDDYRFLLNKVLGFDEIMAEIGMADIDADMVGAVLEQAGRFCAEQIAPLNRSGDEIGCRLVDGVVRTPEGFAQAYSRFVEDGWPSLSGDPRYGGQGLPFTAQVWLDEMLSAANLSFELFPGLTRGAVESIAAHGSDELKEAYLPRMISGEWTGAMALTESSAGTDLALLKTKAVPQGDGSYAVTGTKIFISSGDQDFGNNIVHLVLARIPGAPDGVKGISLLLVPKFLPDGSRNTMSVGALEKKMGIHAQPTCVMNYDAASGWLVGEPNKGLAAMFTMMNTERLMVGIQALGVAGAAYQQAVAYARDRLQGRSADGARGPVPIIEHTDVRRMLLTVRSYVEAARALSGWVALQLDRAHYHPDAQARAEADELVALVTPVVKAAFTDMGFESAVLSQQVFGGHGYIREWGMEQYVRDARITQIYEGTNGVQAMDLVGRKLGMKGGATVERFIGLIERDVEGFMQDAGVVAERMKVSIEHLKSATSHLQRADLDTAGAAATDYLRLFALVSMGWMWTRMAAAAVGEPSHAGKIATARFFAERQLNVTGALAEAVLSGAGPVTDLPLDAF